jgi:hypothetical protein
VAVVVFMFDDLPQILHRPLFFSDNSEVEVGGVVFKTGDAGDMGDVGEEMEANDDEDEEDVIGEMSDCRMELGATVPAVAAVTDASPDAILEML